VAPGQRERSGGAIALSKNSDRTPRTVLKLTPMTGALPLLTRKITEHQFLHL
jgi:hypothetical protein